MIVEIAERQSFEMLKSFPSHIRLHIYAHDMTVILHEIFQSRFQNINQKQHHRKENERAQL